MNNTINKIIEKAKSEKRTLLTEIEAKQVFKEAGLQVTDTRLAVDKKDAVAMSTEMGYPVVLKIVSPDIVHKTEANGVKLNLKTA
jgi:acyl-CoA synthetase (NDP forming)